MIVQPSKRNKWHRNLITLGLLGRTSRSPSPAPTFTSAQASSSNIISIDNQTPSPAVSSTNRHPQLATPAAPSSLSLTVPNSMLANSSNLTISTTSAAVAQAPGQVVLPRTPVSAIILTSCGPVASPSSPPGRGGIDVIWSGLKAFVAVLSTCGDFFGPLKPAINIFVDAITCLEAVIEMTEEYRKLRDDLDCFFQDLAECFEKDVPPGMRPSIINIATSLEREIGFVQRKANQKILGKFTDALQDVDELSKCYRRIQTYLNRMMLNANVSMWMLVDEVATFNRLRELSPSHSAWYSSSESKNVYRDACTPNTRVEALARFQVWRDNPKGETIYWLNGMAGTGKTTLSYTLCKELEASHRLAANFFCSRQLEGCRDANRIIPTIAYQLAQFSYPFRYALSQALLKYPDAHKRRIPEQFTKLLLEPLRETTSSLPQDLVIVIEALDECNNGSSVGEVLDILLEHGPCLPIRFFLTSRPEHVIRKRMLSRTGKRDDFELHLHELDRPSVGDDIKKYLRVGLEPAQVTEEQIEILADRSGVLFIYAATIVRYVGAFDFSRSASRIKQVLKAFTKSGDSEKEIDALYTLVLAEAFNPGLNDAEEEDMRLVLYTIICAREPLTALSIAILLGLEDNQSVFVALEPLRAVLHVEKTGDGITTLHKSFPDYLLDSSRSGHFHCDLKEHSAFLAQRSLDVIGNFKVSFNICGLELSGTSDADIPGLSYKIKEHIPGYLLYACRYWFVHLELVGQSMS